MTGRDDEPRKLEFPPTWDVLQHDRGSETPAASEAPPEQGVSAPLPLINLLAGSWADSVTVLAVCTAALIGLTGAGHSDSFSALPWAAAMAAAWWAFAAAVLVAIRQGTPGMLLAGVVLADRVAPGRLALVVAAAAAQALLLGLPALFGPRRSPIALAASSRLRALLVD